MEKKLNLAIIGQGRSGKDIHGAYYLSERNKYYNVKYVVDADERRRAISEARYEGCIALADYRELFKYDDIDVVVNASYSEQHYEITKDLLEHKFNVLTEKPFAQNQYECGMLMNTAKKNGVTLAVFQNTQLAPFYLDALRIANGEGKIGEVKQVSIRYNGLSRRWDWQTLQKKIAGNAYNTGPHPIAMGLGFLGFSKDTKIEFTKLGQALTSGDAEDYVKIILTAPGKPVIDIEINNTDAFCDYNLKLQGTRGTFKSTPGSYKCVYLLDEEMPPRPVIEEFLQDENGNPLYCSEKLERHEEEGKYDGTAFDVGTAGIYESLYKTLTEGAALAVSCEEAAMVIGVIEAAHAHNPLPVQY